MKTAILTKILMKKMITRRIATNFLGKYIVFLVLFLAQPTCYSFLQFHQCPSASIRTEGLLEGKREYEGQARRKYYPIRSGEGGGDEIDTDLQEENGKSKIKPNIFQNSRRPRRTTSSNSNSSRSGLGFNKAKKPENQVSDSRKSSSPAFPSDVQVLKLSRKWACIQGCGACCYLAPSERPYLMDYFDHEEDLAEYNALVGDDGWCIHFDKDARACKKFEDRPWFCRVEGQTFEKMYGVEPHEMDSFCTSCCREQIADTYGLTSPEMLKFNTAIKALKQEGGGETRPTPIDPFDKQAKPHNTADWTA